MFARAYCTLHATEAPAVLQSDTFFCAVAKPAQGNVEALVNFRGKMHKEGFYKLD